MDFNKYEDAIFKNAMECFADTAVICILNFKLLIKKMIWQGLCIMMPYCITKIREI